MGNAESQRAPSHLAARERRHKPLHILPLGADGCGRRKLAQAIGGDAWSPHPPPLSVISSDFRSARRHLFSSNPEKADDPLRVLFWVADYYSVRQRQSPFLKVALRGKHGVMLCFDVTDRESLAFLRPLAADVRKNASLPHPAVTVVGLKADAPQGERAVSEEEGRAMADLLGAGYAECSAKTGEGVEELVMHVAEEAAYALQFATVGPFELRDGPGQITALLRD